MIEWVIIWILLLIILIIFIWSNGFKIGLTMFFIALLIGIFAGINSVYFTKTGKIISLVLLAIVSFLINYPPTSKYITNKIANFINRKNKKCK